MDDATKRQKAVERINEALGNISIAEKRMAEARQKHDKMVNDAKAQLGTARQQQGEAHLAYNDARAKLFTLVPELCFDE